MTKAQQYSYDIIGGKRRLDKSRILGKNQNPTVHRKTAPGKALL